MLTLTLKPAEFSEVEIACTDALPSLTVAARGDTVAVDIQPTLDGLTWHSPVAGARLKNEERTFLLNLRAGTRKLRVMLQNAHQTRSMVRIMDEDDAASGSTTGK